MRDLETGSVLKYYLNRYFESLVHTKNNIFFDLPQYSDPSFGSFPEYVLARHRPTHRFATMHNFPCDSLNTTRINMWLIQGWQPPPSQTVEDSKFRIEFGKPQIEPLYKDFAVLTINLSSITFFRTRWVKTKQ